MSVSYSLQDNVAVITFDDGKANVYTLEVLEALNSALDRAEADPLAHAVLFVGRPSRFSAGFDLSVMTSSPAAMRTLVSAGARFIARLLLEPLPVVAVCTGHAIAAGALVLLACDHRIGTSGDWKIGLNEVSIGMSLPVWAVELARYRMPPSQFDQIALGQMNGPEEAQRSGFLDRVVEPEDLHAEAMSTAARYSQLSSGAVAGVKARARGMVAHRMLEGLDEDLVSLSGPEAAG